MSTGVPSHALEAIICAQAVQQSLIQNPRRLEAPGYVFNSLFVEAIRQDFPSILLHNPQFPVYISEKDFQPIDPDASLRSSHDANAQGVLVDNALIIPEMKLKPDAKEDLRELLNSNGVETVQQLITLLATYSQRPEVSNLTYHLLEAFRIEIALFIESKRGPPRYLDNIEDYCSSIDFTLGLAQAQAKSQAECAFVSPRTPQQTHIPLVVICGDFWRMSVAVKKPNKAWTLNKYYAIAEEWASKLFILDIKEHEGISKPMQELLDFFSGLSEPNAQEPNEQQREIHNAERDQRAARRSRLNSQPPAQNISPNAKTYMQPFTDKEMNTYWMQSRGEPFFQPVPQDTELDLMDRQWTGVLRFGSPASNAYLKQLRGYCSAKAKQEQQRRKREKI
uniref:Uncharacterized protein n=1 Tax=Mycena chlorophos TaxID=658473 RepID=A0ABQ0L3A1_MYCCL|nr:predicted protein [Mycena chlorophos]